MKFTLKEPSGEGIYSLMRKIGYHFQGKNLGREELIFTSPPKGYPRFHIYLKVKNKNLIFNLHLDQKRPSYQGATAHSGEYEGEVIEREAERIKQFIASGSEPR